MTATAPAATEHAENFFKEGEKYYYGNGVTQDYTQAVYWYRKAAEQGHAIAQNNLGNMYENGLGVPKDKILARYWYEKANVKNIKKRNGGLLPKANEDLIVRIFHIVILIVAIRIIIAVIGTFL